MINFQNFLLFKSSGITFECEIPMKISIESEMLGENKR